MPYHFTPPGTHKRLSTPLSTWEKQIDEILGREMEGILLMNSEQRFEMTERLLSKEGLLKSFIRSSHLSLLEKIEGEIEKIYKEELSDLKYATSSELAAEIRGDINGLGTALSLIQEAKKQII